MRIRRGDWISLVDRWEREQASRREAARTARVWSESTEVEAARAGVAFFRACPEADDEGIVGDLFSAADSDAVVREFAAQTQPCNGRRAVHPILCRVRTGQVAMRRKRLVQGPYEVLQDEAWVMGDNRDNSHDSRSWNGGRGAGVPTDHFKGRAAWIGPSLNADGGTSFERMGADINGAPDLSWAPSLSENLKRCLEKAPNTPP